MLVFEEQINDDLNCLEHYFRKLFELLHETIEEERNIRDRTDFYEPKTRITHLIKPDMLINLYSLLDYWLERLCTHKKDTLQLESGWKDIKGKNDLHVYHKYLTKYARINLENLQFEYQRINELRIIRNIFVHKGGHPSDQEQAKLVGIEGISSSLGTIEIHNKFIWSNLRNIRTYLLEIAKYS